MASTTLAVASDALRLGTAGGTSSAGVDIVYGFTGTDPLPTGAQRVATDDRFLDDAGGSFDAPLGYALSFQYLLAEAWKGEPSAILRHLDHDGSCAPVAEDERASLERDVTTSDEVVVAAVDLVVDHVAADHGADGTTGNDSDADFADAGMAGADFFGMS